MSLLGRLLSGAGPSTTSAPRTPLDSHLEDQFTYNLLFPDPDALCHHDQVFQLSSATILAPAALRDADVNGEIDLDARDVRVIIMQEATPSSGSAYLLFDSHAPPPPSPSLDRQASGNGPAYPSRTEGRRSISSPRKLSVGQNTRPLIIQEPSTPRAFGAFGGRTQHNKTASYNETAGQRSAREYREEVSCFASYMFGNSDVMAYKGFGTKVHPLPSESRHPFTSGSYVADGSLGRSSMRSSKLAQSFTSDTVPGPTSAGFTSTARAVDRKKVLITRMFPVPLPNDETEDAAQNTTPTQQSSSGAAGYPFPKVAANGAHSAEFRKPQPKQKRTPMYAVGVVVNWPQSTTFQGLSAPASRSSFRGSGSFTEQDSLPSSFNSGRRSGWTVLGHGFGVESLDSSFSSEPDDRIENITQHWDIIMRTMSHLQAVATASLLPMLKHADINSPDPRRESTHARAPSASISISGKRVQEDVKPFKIPKSNAKMVQLTANCLSQVQRIHREADAARQRIVTGLKAHQVVTGQGRWGIWREEARLVGKWAGGKDEGFFFFNLLTGFLGNHTEWLQALGPSWYRRRHHQQQRANKDDDISLPARTIILSDNKLMARRLIFLLSAFLPANQQVTLGRMHRPSTSTSFGGYSQSPPNVPILREESLRRRINKRGSVARGSHARTSSFPNPALLGLGPEIHHDRRTSDATSIKTANLPIPGSDLNTRKSSAATTSTATPVTTMPHFSTRRPIRGTGPAPRPGSSGSLATDDLLRSLKRGESTGHYSTASTDSQGQNSRWGSMISGFWGSKRRDSTASTSIEPPSLEDLDIHDPHYKSGSPLKKGKLAEMVDEVTQGPVQKTKEQQERDMRKSESGSASTAKPEDEPGEDIPEQIIHVAERVADPSGAFESPVKTSINHDDGVIDIDVPLPDYLSFETAVSSPSSSGYLSTPGLGNGMDGFENYSRSGPDVETTMNVGGWLPRYHPDFALQAIPVQGDILEEVKASMRAEPIPLLTSNTPLPEGSRLDRWVDISSAVIADTTNFTIKHIRYRRLIRQRNVSSATPSIPHSFDSRYGNVYAASQLTPSTETYDGSIEEEFIEEPIISMDETLIEAVERIIAQSGRGSKTSSACSSRSASRQRGSRERSNSDAGIPEIPEHKLEVPRNECKRMVLGALEEIVREVAESRREGGDAEADMERESFLREGVRSWLSDVETGETSHQNQG
ncbi:folliculin-interacting protein N-terminus-domain-containing protein [Leptodontidium sp. 2 PMI_412]|nr:folliculin-interacting protein N-terminus-domain-containing protein [Leptodontidium sp. MPI-SDFR-AT-0119]KAH9219606.1 folliculin-interacting protein N-terminus-domain-containing protein [Leptodontidium sp. 2 PMI_412]